MFRCLDNFQGFFVQKDYFSSQNNLYEKHFFNNKLIYFNYLNYPNSSYSIINKKLIIETTFIFLKFLINFLKNRWPCRNSIFWLYFLHLFSRERLLNFKNLINSISCLKSKFLNILFVWLHYFKLLNIRSFTFIALFALFPNC